MSEEGPIVRTQIATWSTGHTLRRFMSVHGDSVWPTRPSFMLLDPRGREVFTIDTLPMSRLRTGAMDVQIHVPRGRPPYADHRLNQALLVSTIREVLRLRVQTHLSRSALLAPILMVRKDLESTLGWNENLETLARDIERHKDGVQKAAMRSKYFSDTSAQFRCIPWFGELESLRVSVAKWNTSTYRFQPPVSEKIYENLPDTRWVVGFEVDLDRMSKPDLGPMSTSGVSCRVKVVHRDNYSESIVLGESRRSLLDAVLEAGLIWPVDTLQDPGSLEDAILRENAQEKALEAWADQVLESAPEVTECFDVESYLLLGQRVPYLWGPMEFMAWASSARGET